MVHDQHQTINHKSPSTKGRTLLSCSNGSFFFSTRFRFTSPRTHNHSPEMHFNSKPHSPVWTFSLFCFVGWFRIRSSKDKRNSATDIDDPAPSCFYSLRNRFRASRIFWVRHFFASSYTFVFYMCAPESSHCHHSASQCIYLPTRSPEFACFALKSARRVKNSLNKLQLQAPNRRR